MKKCFIFFLVSKNQFCIYEEYEDVLLDHVDEIYENKTKDECKALCDNSGNINCRGYGLEPTNETLKITSGTFYRCLISSEDSKVHGPRLLTDHKGAKYYEKAPCLNSTFRNNLIFFCSLI